MAHLVQRDIARGAKQERFRRHHRALRARPKQTRIGILHNVVDFHLRPKSALQPSAQQRLVGHHVLHEPTGVIGVVHGHGEGRTAGHRLRLKIRESVHPIERIARVSRHLLLRAEPRRGAEQTPRRYRASASPLPSRRSFVRRPVAFQSCTKRLPAASNDTPCGAMKMPSCQNSGASLNAAHCF